MCGCASRSPLPRRRLNANNLILWLFKNFYFIHDRRRAEHEGKPQAIPPPPKDAHTWPHPGFTAGSRHTCAAVSYRCLHPAFTWSRGPCWRAQRQSAQTPNSGKTYIYNNKFWDVGRDSYTLFLWLSLCSLVAAGWFRPLNSAVSQPRKFPKLFL